MELDHDLCYRALRARDRRFDGRFFTGVLSTGVYCRPICPARTPRSDRCVFFACAAAAEDAGFRACRRCRPETSPGTPAWAGTSATVARGLRLISAGALDEGGVEDLAARLGVGGRHLRRLFVEHLGVAPLAVAHTRRAHLARRLLTETDLTVSQIALAAGFRNTRRLHAAMMKSFAAGPIALRRAVRTPSSRNRGVLMLKLAYREPFDWSRLLAYLEPRAIPGVEAVADGRYLRTVSLDGVDGVIVVAPARCGVSALELSVPSSFVERLPEIVSRTRALFDLDADPDVVAEHLGRDPGLARLLRSDAGLRVPGSWDPFELAVRAVLGQQITVAGATRLAGRVVSRWGRDLPGAEEAPDKLFPGPADLADADFESEGVTAARSQTLRALARAVDDDPGLLAIAGSQQEALDALIALPGVGDWTAQYVAMRGLSEPDAFPAGDLGLRKALTVDDERPTAAAVRRVAEPWRPWRAYAAMLLWRADGRKSG